MVLISLSASTCLIDVNIIIMFPLLYLKFIFHQKIYCHLTSCCIKIAWYKNSILRQNKYIFDKHIIQIYLYMFINTTNVVCINKEIEEIFWNSLLNSTFFLFFRFCNVHVTSSIVFIQLNEYAWPMNVTLYK